MGSNFKILCDGCHDLLMLTLIITDIAIITFKSDDYCCFL